MYTIITFEKMLVNTFFIAQAFENDYVDFRYCKYPKRGLPPRFLAVLFSGSRISVLSCSAEWSISYLSVSAKKLAIASTV